MSDRDTAHVDVLRHLLCPGAAGLDEIAGTRTLARMTTWSSVCTRPHDIIRVGTSPAPRTNSLSTRRRTRPFRPISGGCSTCRCCRPDLLSYGLSCEERDCPRATQDGVQGQDRDPSRYIVVAVERAPPPARACPCFDRACRGPDGSGRRETWPRRRGNGQRHPEFALALLVEPAPRLTMLTDADRARHEDRR